MSPPKIKQSLNSLKTKSTSNIVNESPIKITEENRSSPKHGLQKDLTIEDYKKDVKLNTISKFINIRLDNDASFGNY